MKRVLLALALFLVPSLASAQCTGVFTARTGCGTVTQGTPHMVPWTSVSPFLPSVTGPERWYYPFEQIAIGSDTNYGGVLNVTGRGIDSNVFNGTGSGSPGSPSNAPVTITLTDYSVGHSGLLNFQAVDSAGTLHGQAAGINPGFIFWDAGHMQTDFDFNGYRNGNFEGLLQIYTGCQAGFNTSANGPAAGCPSDETAQFAPAQPYIFNLGGIQGGGIGQRWLNVFAMNTNLGTNSNVVQPYVRFVNASGGTIGQITGLTNTAGISYDANGHNFLTNGIVVGAATGGALGVGTVNVAVDLYKNNTAYTNPDYVFEKLYTGKIERFVANPGASEYKQVPTIDEAEAITKATLRLPGMTDEPLGVFGRADKVLEKLEEAHAYIFQLNAEIKKLTACNQSWRCRWFGLQQRS